MSRIVSDVSANDEPYVDFQNPGHTLLPTFPSFRPMGMVGEACLSSNAYYPRTPDYTLYSGVHVCWFEHSDSSFVHGFMCLDYGLGTMTTTTYPFVITIVSVDNFLLCQENHLTASFEVSEAVALIQCPSPPLKQNTDITCIKCLFLQASFSLAYHAPYRHKHCFTLNWFFCPFEKLVIVSGNLCHFEMLLIVSGNLWNSPNLLSIR